MGCGGSNGHSTQRCRACRQYCPARIAQCRASRPAATEAGPILKDTQRRRRREPAAFGQPERSRDPAYHAADDKSGRFQFHRKFPSASDAGVEPVFGTADCPRIGKIRPRLHVVHFRRQGIRQIRRDPRPNAKRTGNHHAQYRSLDLAALFQDDQQTKPAEAAQKRCHYTFDRIQWPHG